MAAIVKDPVLADAGEVWASALAELKLQMTGATFTTWLSRSWVAEQDGSNWTIGVEHAYAVDWLTNRLAGMVNRTLARYAGGPVAVRYVVGKRPAPEVGADRDPPLQESTLEDVPAADDASSLDDVPSIEEVGPIIEAVREERAAVGTGGALVWTDFYIKLKVAFRKRALKKLKGARLSVFLCLALHVDRDGIAKPGGIEAIMHETGYSRGAVCSALDALDHAGLIDKIPTHHGADQYRVRGYAWFGQAPAPALWEESKYKK